MTNRMRQGLMLIVGLIGCVSLVPGSAQAAIFTASNTPVLRVAPEYTTQHVQLLEQELQDWRQRRDVIDAQIADIDIRLKDPTLTEAGRKALEDRRSGLEWERKSADEWIKRIFERLIHVP